MKTFLYSLTMKYMDQKISILINDNSMYSFWSFCGYRNKMFISKEDYKFYFSSETLYNPSRWHGDYSTLTLSSTIFL